MVSCHYNPSLAEYIILPEFVWPPYGLAGVQEGKKNKCGPQSLAGWLVGKVKTRWGRSLRPHTELNGALGRHYSLVLISGEILKIVEMMALPNLEMDSNQELA